MRFAVALGEPVAVAYEGEDARSRLSGGPTHDGDFARRRVRSDHKPEELRGIPRERSGDRSEALSQVRAVFKIEGKSTESAEPFGDSGGANGLGEAECVSRSDVEWEYRVLESECPKDLRDSVGRSGAP